MATSRSILQSRSRSPPPRRPSYRDSYTPPRRGSRTRSLTPRRGNGYRRSRSRTPPRRTDRYSRSYDSRSWSGSRTPPRGRDRDQRDEYPRSRSPRRYSPQRLNDDTRAPKDWDSRRHYSPARGRDKDRSLRKEEDRSRSRSRTPPPRRDPPRSGKGGGGFKWKEKSRQDDRNGVEDRGSYRGYRDRDPPRPRAASPLLSTNGTSKHATGDKEPRKDKKKKATPTIAPVGQEMIIVNVNDRLGTKASIPCLASDPISTSLPFFQCPGVSVISPLFHLLVLSAA